ncbi:hypothetical protein D3C81_1727510 [compost metagenome]
MRREPACQLFLQLRMRQRMAADQMRRAAAGAVAVRAFRQRGDHLRMVGQSHVIVAAESQQRLRLRIDGAHGLVRRARGVRDAAAARQGQLLALCGGLFQLFKQHGKPPRRW